jgi:hypothetical protein
VPLRTLQRGPASRRGGGSIRLAAIAVISTVAVTVLATLTGPGAAAVAWIHALVEFYAGVVSLVTLSITVMVGLAATERVVFRINQRVHLQMVHRALAFTSVAFLGVHVLMKVMEDHASVLDVVIPFRASHRSIAIGLGTMAAYLMVTVLWTGIARARFAGSGRPWLWRTLHSAAYLAWPIALVHGLQAGRAAKPWVLVSYVLCLLLVVVALVIRLVGWLNRPTPVPLARTAAIPQAQPTIGATAFAVTVTTEPTPIGPYREALPPRPAIDAPRVALPRVPNAEQRPPAPAQRTVRLRRRGAHADRPVAHVPPPEPQPSLSEDASDEQFWAFMRGRQQR